MLSLPWLCSRPDQSTCSALRHLLPLRAILAMRGYTTASPLSSGYGTGGSASSYRHFAHEIDFEIAIDLTEAELNEMGVREKGRRKRTLRCRTCVIGACAPQGNALRASSSSWDATPSPARPTGVVRSCRFFFHGLRVRIADQPCLLSVCHSAYTVMTGVDTRSERGVYQSPRTIHVVEVQLFVAVWQQSLLSRCSIQWRTPLGTTRQC